MRFYKGQTYLVLPSEEEWRAIEEGCLAHEKENNGEGNESRREEKLIKLDAAKGVCALFRHARARKQFVRSATFL
jgi:hypothetical protein